MHFLLLIFYMSCCLSLYAADRTPEFSASKTTSVASSSSSSTPTADDDTNKVLFLIPTDDGRITIELDIQTTEPISLEPYTTHFNENMTKGLPGIIGHVSYLNGANISYSSYIAENICATFEHQDELRDPRTNVSALNADFHLVTNYPIHPETHYLGEWASNESIIKALCANLQKLAVGNQSPLLNSIAFYAATGDTYCRHSYNKTKETLIENNAHAALHFYQKAIQSIPDKLENNVCKELNEHKVNCLRRCGNILGERYKMHKRYEDMNAALGYYTDAQKMGDQSTVDKFNMIINITNAQDLKKWDGLEDYLVMLTKMNPSKNPDMYLKIANVHAKLGNTQQASDAYHKHNALMSLPVLPSILKRDRKLDAQDNASSKQRKLT